MSVSAAAGGAEAAGASSACEGCAAGFDGASDAGSAAGAAGCDWLGGAQLEAPGLKLKLGALMFSAVLGSTIFSPVSSSSSHESMLCRLACLTCKTLLLVCKRILTHCNDAWQTLLGDPAKAPCSSRAPCTISMRACRLCDFAPCIAAAAPGLAYHYELSAGSPAASAVRGSPMPAQFTDDPPSEGFCRRSCLHELPNSNGHVQCTWQAHARPCTQPGQEAETM